MNYYNKLPFWVYVGSSSGFSSTCNSNSGEFEVSLITTANYICASGTMGKDLQLVSSVVEERVRRSVTGKNNY